MIDVKQIAMRKFDVYFKRFSLYLRTRTRSYEVN